MHFQEWPFFASGTKTIYEPDFIAVRYYMLKINGPEEISRATHWTT